MSKCTPHTHSIFSFLVNFLLLFYYIEYKLFYSFAFFLFLFISFFFIFFWNNRCNLVTVDSTSRDYLKALLIK